MNKEIASKREPVPGQDLAKHRIRVSFEFDVICNDGPVRNLSYDEGGTMSTALLKSFLVANKANLLDVMVDTIGSQLGMHSCETFMREFLSQVNADQHVLFKPAIGMLDNDEKQYWHEIEQDTSDKYGDWLACCTEEIFECFRAQFVNSSYEIVEVSA